MLWRVISIRTYEDSVESLYRLVNLLLDWIIIIIINMCAERKCVEDEGDEKFGRVQFSHEDLVKLTKDAINKVIESDPVFHGLPPDATTEEIKAQTAVAQGQAITVYLNRQELPKLPIVVPPHTTTVLDLKKAIKRYTDLSLRREKTRKKISWKHVWKKYQLCFNDIVLDSDNENIKNYGISNKVEIYYTKRRI